MLVGLSDLERNPLAIVEFPDPNLEFPDTNFSSAHSFVSMELMTLYRQLQTLKLQTLATWSSRSVTLCTSLSPFPVSLFAHTLSRRSTVGAEGTRCLTYLSCLSTDCMMAC